MEMLGDRITKILHSTEAKPSIAIFLKLEIFDFSFNLVHTPLSPQHSAVKLTL